MFAFVISLSGDLDLTGIATAVLALATAGLAGWTRASVREVREEGRRGRRPVLVPFDPPEIGNDGSLVIGVKNVGSGPAMGIEAVVVFGDQDGYRSTQNTAFPRARGMLAAVGAGEPALPVTIPNVNVGSLTGFRLTLYCQDLAGAHWWTQKRYSRRDEAYLDIPGAGGTPSPGAGQPAGTPAPARGPPAPRNVAAPTPRIATPTLSTSGVVSLTLTAPALSDPHDVLGEQIALNVFAGAAPTTRAAAAAAATRGRKAKPKLVGTVRKTVRLHSRQRLSVRIVLSKKLARYVRAHPKASVQLTLTSTLASHARSVTTRAVKRAKAKPRR